MTAPMVSANVRIVLVRPQGSGNVGSVARAMKNMGLATLVLVDPAPLDDGWASAMAVHARDVLESATRVRSLADAVADCAWVVGTAARSGPFRGQVLAPRDLAIDLLRVAATQPVALVFGPEDHGLSNAEIEHCQAMVTIPTADAYTSLNLAQAVLVCAYELHLAATSDSGDRGLSVPRPTAARLALLFDRLQQALLAIGFLNPQNPKPVMNVFRRIFARAGLQDHDARVLLGLARQVQWLADQLAHAGHAPKHEDDSIETS